MPNYDYQGKSCNNYTEHRVSYEKRNEDQECGTCGGLANYVISMPRVYVFEPYHDEALNCDIRGKRHKEQVLAAEGLIEAGDRVNGSRDFDSRRAVGVLPPQGVSHDDNRRAADKRKKQGDEMVVGVDQSNAYGESRTTWHRVKDLETKLDTKTPSIGDVIRKG